MNSTLFAGAIAFAFLATYGGAVYIYNRILHKRARIAAKCFLSN